jgi:hypothetical protein
VGGLRHLEYRTFGNGYHSSQEGGRKMKFYTILALALVLVLATSAVALEKKSYQLKEDFGTAPLYDCALNYYYYIPCPTYSWFWSYTGWTPGEVIGMCFNIGDQGTGGYAPCDPSMCQKLEQFRILDFAGYGTVYPGLFTVEFDVYCAGEYCCGTAAPYMHLWNSGPLETGYAWNYFVVDPPLCLTPCCLESRPGCSPSIVLTATHTGTDGVYPAWGMDNISTAIETGCVLHDYGCLPAAYPRGWCGGAEPKVHGGYIGTFPFQYWPPLMFCDGRDTTPDCSQFGGIELAWRIYLICDGSTATKPSTWGNIKRIYR